MSSTKKKQNKQMNTASASAFLPRNVASRSLMSSARTLNMIEGGVRTSPGANLKPMADGTFKEAGAFLPEYLLEVITYSQHNTTQNKQT